MATKVNIWNMALSHLGNTNRVVNDTDQTAEALSCALYWDVVLDEVLDAVPWPFATKISALAGKTATPNIDWAFSYTYPADCVTARRILDTVTRGKREKSKIPFRRDTDKIYTDIDNATLEYTMRVTDTTKFRADFTEAVAFLLAARIAHAVGGDQQIALRKSMTEQYDAKVKEAAANASAEEHEEPTEITVAGNPKEDIANAALAYIGVDHEIRSLASEKTLEARTARQFYDTTRDDTLRSFPWMFARKSAALGTKVAAPSTEWAFSYAMPADAVQILKIFDVAGRIPAGQSRIPFRRATGDLIYTNVDNATCEYTMRHDTPSQYPPDFRVQFAIRLAIKMVPRLVPVAERETILKTLAGLLQANMSEVVGNATMEERDLSPETSATGKPSEDVCNEALMLLGSKREIQTLATELTDEARAFRQVFSKSLDRTLRDFNWAFARKTATLALITADPTTEWSYSYTVPSDCVALRRILTGDGTRQETEESRIQFELAYTTLPVIYTDQANAIAEYTVRITDMTQLPPDFRNAFAARLAFDVCNRLIDEKRRERVRAEMMVNYRTALGDAHRNAAMEEVPEQETASSLERMRGS